MKKILLLLIMMPFALLSQNFWTETFPFSGDYYVADISIVDASTVWVTGTNLNGMGTWSVGRWGLSTDGGLTWTDGFLQDDVNWPNHSTQYTTNISGTSDQTAYIGTANDNYTNKLLVTHDAGNTWTQIHPELFSEANSFLCGVHFFDNNHGITFGDPENNYFEIYTTTDAAATWTRTPSINIPAPLSNEYVLINHFETTAGIIRFMTTKGRLFKSQNQGMTWSVSQTPDNPEYSLGYSHRYFSFKNANEGLLVTFQNQLYHTLDGGTIWIAYRQTEYYLMAARYMSHKRLALITTRAKLLTTDLGVPVTLPIMEIYGLF